MAVKHLPAEMPAISNTSYCSNTYDPSGTWENQSVGSTTALKPWDWTEAELQKERRVLKKMGIEPQEVKEQDMPNVTCRMVQIFIVDPDKRVPVEKRCLYQTSEPFMTDLTDQELYHMQVDIKMLLELHNNERRGIVDKEASRLKEKDVYLDEIRIRDLKMVVVELATF